MSIDYSVRSGRAVFGAAAPTRLLDTTMCTLLFWLADLIVTASIGLLAFKIYPNDHKIFDYSIAILVSLAFYSIFARYFQVYNVKTFIAQPGKYKEVLKAWVMTWLAVVMALVLAKTSFEYSRVWMVSWLIAGGMFLILARIPLDMAVRRLAANGRFRNRAVIYGVSATAQDFLAQQGNAPHTDSYIIGFADDRRRCRENQPGAAPVLCDLDGLVQRIRKNDVQIVYVALPWTARARRRQIVQRLTETPVQVRIVPGSLGLEEPLRMINGVGDWAVFGIRNTFLDGRNALAKGIFDRIVVSLLIFFSAPLMLLIAAAIKLDSPGRVIFSQTRRGYNDRGFTVFKFRTLYEGDADPTAQNLVAKDDPRVTPVGRFLRRSSLDELPQLFNVLFGEMSLVGPRPHAPTVLAAGKPYEQAVERYIARYNVKPGITGLAQIHGHRGETDTIDKLRRRVACDMMYIREWSLWLDIKILLLTIPALMRGENAY